MPTKEEFENSLAPYLTAHPASKIVEIETSTGKALMIARPWADESLSINLPDESKKLVDALNNVILPERYTALWHKDTKKFEVIWTAYPVNPLWREIFGREFKFRYNSREHECQFATSSERLIEIARNYQRVSASSTNFRNLESFKIYAHYSKSKQGSPEPSSAPLDLKPMSFWVTNVEWNEDEILVFVNHLNFYLTYYDVVSPYILIHSSSEPLAAKPQTRYGAEKFPTQIDARELDDILLQLWMASRLGDEGRRFLYCFRIIEYASFSYLAAKARLDIRKILATPHALDDITSLTERVVGALERSKLEDYPKFEALLDDVVDPSLLWREISQNIDAFTSVTKFDGGVELKPLIPVGTTEAQFAVNGMRSFHDSIRKIRNGLAHGRDPKSAGVITPTTRNLERLRPWVSLISVAAGEVVLLKNMI